MASDFDDYLRYRRPPGFQFEFPAGKKFVWCRQGEKRDRTYVIAEVLDESDPNNIRVRIRDTAEEKIVGKDDVEGVNPAKFDGVEDCAMLGYLSQPSVLHNLKLRYDANCIYTHSGLFTVAINPYRLFPIYTDAVIKRYINRRRNEVPPHVFSVADEAYRHLLVDRKSQSMLVTGESGAGKTENAKRIIQYLATVSGRSGAEGLLEKQLLQANPLLEAVGNAKTLKNNNSSRFGKFIKITFDTAGYLSGASIVSYLLETSRVVHQGPGERTFHIFYQLFKGAPQELRNQLKLTRPEDFFYLNQSGCTEVASIDDQKEFNATVFAMDTLGFTKEEQNMIFRVVAGILHLGNTTFSGEENAQIDNETPAKIAAELLKVDYAALKQGLIAPRITISQREKVTKSMTPFQASRSRDALAKAIYNRLFLWIVDKINKTLKVHNEHLFIGILDIAGFEIFKLNSFEQLCINFTNERLQQFFNNHMFHLEQEEYKREKIEWTFINFGIDSQATIDLIAKKPRGILNILDEQSVFPKATDESFVAALTQTHAGKNPKFRKENLASAVSFGIEHYAGSVEYDATQWIEKNKDPLQDDLGACISASKDEGIAFFFKNFNPTGIQKGASFMTVGLKYRESLDDLMSTLEKTYPHFIRCIIPNHRQVPGVIDDAIVLDQLACNGVLEGIRISRMGFPNRTPYADFLKRYYLLDTTVPKQAPDPKAATKKIIEKIAKDGVVDMEKIRFGVTKIFFRAGEMAKVEELREKIVGGMITGIQALARGYVGRKVYAMMRAKKIAAEVLQRAIRTYLENKLDPWWRLTMKARDPAWQKIAEREKYERELREKLVAIDKKKEEVEAQKAAIREKMAEIEREKAAVLEQVAAVKEEQDRKRAEVDVLKAELKSLHDALEATEETLKDMESDLRSKHVESANVEAQIRQMQASISAGSAEQRKIELEIKNVEAAIAKAKAALEEEQANVAALTKAQKELDLALDDKQGDQSELVKKKGALTQENAKIQGEVMRLGAEKQKIVAENKANEKKVQGLQAEVKDTQPKLDKLTKERKDLEEANKKKEADIVSLTNELEGQKEIAARLKKEGLQYDGEASERQDAVENARKYNKKLVDGIKLAKEQQSSLESVVNSLVNENTAAKAANTKLEAREAELKKKIADGNAKIAALTKEIATLTQKNEELHAQVEAVEKQLSDLVKNSKRAEEQLSILREQHGELAAAVQRDAKNKEKLEQRIEELKSQLKDEKVRREGHDTALQRVKASVESTRTELESAKIDKERIAKTNEQLNKSLHTLQLDHKAALAKVDEINRKIANVMERREELLEQKEILSGDKDKLVARQEKITEAIEEKKKKADEAGDVNKTYKEKQNQVSGEIEKMKAENARLNKENEALERKVRQLENEVKEKREKLRETEDAQVDAKKEGGAIEVQIQTEKLRLQEREAAIERAKEELRRGETELELAQRRLDEGKSRQVELERDIKELEAKVAERKDALAAEARIRDALKQRLNAIEDEKDDVIEAQRAAEASRAADERMTNIRREMDAIRFNIEDLQKAKLSDERDVLSLRGELDILRRNARSLAVDNDALERERKAGLMRLQALTKETMEVEANNSIMEQRIKAIEKKVAKALKKGELVNSAEAQDKAAAEEAEMEKKLREARATLRQLENDIKNERRAAAHYAHKAAAVEAEKEHLEAALNDAHNANVHLVRYGDVLKREVDDLKTELEADRAHLQTLRTIIEQKDVEMEETKKGKRDDSEERDRAQSRIHELKRALLALKEDIAHEQELTDKNRAIAHRLNNLIRNAESNDPESPLDAPEAERAEAIRRQTARAVKITKKLNERLAKLLVEKDTQDKITWRLQDECQQMSVEVHDAAIAREIAQKEVDFLHKQLMELREYSRDAESEAEKARFRAQELARDIESVKDRITEFQDKNSVLERYKDKYKKKLKSLASELEVISARREDAAQEKLRLELLHRALKRQLADERDARIQLEHNLHRTTVELEKARNELHLAKAKLANDEREAAQFAESYKQTQHQLNKLQKRLASEGETARIEAQLYIAREELETARKRTAEARAEALAREEEAEALEFDIRSLRYDLNQLALKKARMERAQTQLQNLLHAQRRAEEEDDIDLDGIELPNDRDDSVSEAGDGIEVA